MALCNLFHRPAADRAVRRFIGNGRCGTLSRESISFLDQEPIGLVRPAGRAMHAHQNPIAFELLSEQFELELAVDQALFCIAVRGALPLVPSHHATAAVLPLRNRSFESVILPRVVLYLHREPLVAGIVARALCHRPTFQNPIQAESEVAMQPSSRMFLHHERQSFHLAPHSRFALIASRLSRHAEVALRLVVRQWAVWPRGLSRFRFSCGGHSLCSSMLAFA